MDYDIDAMAKDFLYLYRTTPTQRIAPLEFMQRWEEQGHNVPKDVHSFLELLGKVVERVKEKRRSNMKAYLANSLFSTADQFFNSYLAEQIREAIEPAIELYVPQENPALNDKSGYADSVTIYNGDNVFLDSANILIAVLDGAEIDAGVATEVGRYTTLMEHRGELGLPPMYVYGLYTDVRQQGRDNGKKITALIDDPTENQFMYRNLYTVGAIKSNGKIFSSVHDLIDHIKKVHG